MNIETDGLSMIRVAFEVFWFSGRKQKAKNTSFITDSKKKKERKKQNRLFLHLFTMNYLINYRRFF